MCLCVYETINYLVPRWNPNARFFIVIIVLEKNILENFNKSSKWWKLAFHQKNVFFFGVSVKNRKLRFYVLIFFSVCLESDGNGVNIVTEQLYILYIHIIFIFLSYSVNELIIVRRKI